MKAYFVVVYHCIQEGKSLSIPVVVVNVKYLAALINLANDCTFTRAVISKHTFWGLSFIRHTSACRWVLGVQTEKGKHKIIYLRLS